MAITYNCASVDSYYAVREQILAKAFGVDNPFLPVTNCVYLILKGSLKGEPGKQVEPGDELSNKRLHCLVPIGETA